MQHAPHLGHSFGLSECPSLPRFTSFVFLESEQVHDAKWGDGLSSSNHDVGARVGGFDDCSLEYRLLSSDQVWRAPEHEYPHIP